MCRSWCNCWRSRVGRRRRNGWCRCLRRSGCRGGCWRWRRSRPPTVLPAELPPVGDAVAVKVRFQVRIIPRSAEIPVVFSACVFVMVAIGVVGIQVPVEIDPCIVRRRLQCSWSASCCAASPGLVVALVDVAIRVAVVSSNAHKLYEIYLYPNSYQLLARHCCLSDRRQLGLPSLCLVE